MTWSEYFPSVVSASGGKVSLHDFCAILVALWQRIPIWYFRPWCDQELCSLFSPWCDYFPISVLSTSGATNGGLNNYQAVIIFLPNIPENISIIFPAVPSPLPIYYRPIISPNIIRNFFGKLSPFNDSVECRINLLCSCTYIQAHNAPLGHAPWYLIL